METALCTHIANPHSHVIGSSKQPVHFILMGVITLLVATGTIIKFDKACDELLHLHVGDQPVAEGEAVKIGDKFGFRVLGMLIPEEHFLKVRQTKVG